MAKQQKMVDEDSLKRQARRRLIGAVALVTAVVVLLPMVLDREPRPEGQNIELNIPDKDRSGEFNPPMIPASAPAPAALPPAEHPAPESLPPAASHVSGTIQPAVTPPAPATTPVQAKPAAKVVPVQPATTQPAPSPEKSVVAPSAEATHAPAQAAPPASFVVQIGAFSKADTAHNLQKKLSKQGIKAYTEKAGDKLRVRAGPYATREAADKARRKLEAMGLHPIVSPAQ